MSLDKRLRQILDWQGKTYWQILRASTSKQASQLLKKDTEVNVALIREAFADEERKKGYLAPKDNKGNFEIVMTGQEWYDRFKKELNKIAPTGILDWEFSGEEVLKAAKKATGIK